jgi:hypothetical protein
LADQNDADFFGYLSDQQRTDLTDLLKDIVRRRDLKNIPIS